MNRKENVKDCNRQQEISVLYIERRGLMEDNQIIELYWQRSENAITETSNKYSRLLVSIALNILGN